MTDPEEGAFDAAMLNIYHRAKREAKYNATRFLQMISEQGGLVTARHLLASPPSDGCTTLYLMGKQELTVEALVQHPDFIHLFSDEEIAVAMDRVGDRRVSPPNRRAERRPSQ